MTSSCPSRCSRPRAAPRCSTRCWQSWSRRARARLRVRDRDARGRPRAARLRGHGLRREPGDGRAHAGPRRRARRGAADRDADVGRTRRRALRRGAVRRQLAHPRRRARRAAGPRSTACAGCRATARCWSSRRATGSGRRPAATRPSSATAAARRCGASGTTASRPGCRSSSTLEDGSSYGEELSYWPFTHAELDEDLRAAGFEPETSTWTADAERYAVTSRANVSNASR